MTEIDALLPLPQATFHILLALADEDRHGYAIMQDVDARTGGELKLGPGTLYRSIQRMLEQGLIVETRTRPAAGDDNERRQYLPDHVLRPQVARAETRRLNQLVRARQGGGLCGGPRLRRRFSGQAAWLTRCPSGRRS